MKYAADFRSIARNVLKGKWGIATYIAVFAIVTGVALFILGSIVEVGYMKFNLDLVDRQKETEIGTMFGYFQFWKTTACARLLQSVYVLL